MLCLDGLIASRENSICMKENNGYLLGLEVGNTTWKCGLYGRMLVMVIIIEDDVGYFEVVVE